MSEPTPHPMSEGGKGQLGLSGSAPEVQQAADPVALHQRLKANFRQATWELSQILTTEGIERYTHDVLAEIEADDG